MKKIALILCSLVTLPMFAQEVEPQKEWTFTGVGGLNVSQTSLTNWAAGGENSMSGNIYFNASANYKKDKWTWDNMIASDFGQAYTKTLKWQTSVDKLNLSSKLGYAVLEKMSISALGDFLTQYTPGYKSAQSKNDGDDYISNIMAPGYLSLALGIDYRPNDDLSIMFSPLTGKMTFVLDKRLSEMGAYGVKPGNKVFAELGASLVALYKKNITEDLSLQTKLSLFTAYTHNFGNIDVNWDVMLAYKLNKYLSATLTTNLIYDDDIKTADEHGKLTGPAKVQFREIFGVGVAYHF